MRLPDCYIDPLEVRYIMTVDDSRIFELASPFRYIGSRGTITVPAGFTTDGASVPRVFWSIFQPFGEYFPAAVVHDYLYSPRSMHLRLERKTADLIFKEAMYNLGIGWLTRGTIYQAVRLGGWRSYQT
jgi:hypothetical protein